MRIYGASPLYNYVELVFRCKRLFILAVVLGTGLTSILVSMRPRQYEASLGIALAPGPDPLRRHTDNDQDVEATVDSRLRRLAVLLKSDPDFVPAAAELAGLKRKYGRRFPEVARQLRNAVGAPTQLASDVAEVRLTWADPDEAQNFLTRLLEQYRAATVAAETRQSKWLVDALNDQLGSAAQEANKAAQERTGWYIAKYHTAPGYASTALTSLDDSDRELVSTNTQLLENRSRLGVVERQLRSTPQTKMMGSTTQVSQDPGAAYQSRLDDLNAELAAKRLRYQDSHPEVRALLQQVEDVKAQMALARKHRTLPNEERTQRDETTNPQWEKLQAEKDRLTQDIWGLEQRISQLTNERAKNQQWVQQMPRDEVRFRELDRDYNLKDTVRQTLQAKLYSATIQYKQDESLAAKSIDFAWPLRAELVDTSGKRALLYGLGPMLGLLIAFCFSLMAEAVDHSLRTPVDVEKYLGKPVLAVIPRMAPARPAPKQLAESPAPRIPSQ